MTGKLHLAIDIGSESGRAFVGCLHNGRLETREIHRFVTQDLFFVNRRIRNLYRYYEEILKALKIFAQEYGTAPESIGVDAWGSDFVLLNSAGEIAELPNSYRDLTIATQMPQLVEERFGIWNVYERCGNQEMPMDTLHQLLMMKETCRPAIQNPQSLLFLADAFHYMLGGEAVCEHSLASYCRFFNQEQDCWDDKIIDAMGLPAAIKTNIIRCGDKVGELLPQLCDEAGFARGVSLIAPCSHDTACAALAVPDNDGRWAFISSGTWSLIGIETEKPVITKEGWQFNFSNSSMPFHTNMFKKITTGMWIIQQCAKHWGRYSYDEILEMAEQSPDKDWFIDPDDKAFYNAPDMPKAICGVVNEQYGVGLGVDNVGAIARVFFQSIALKYRYVLEKIVRVSGYPIDKVYILGGGSKNRLINQFTANAFGRGVYTGVHEASATGNLMIQAYGCGEVESKQQIRQILLQTFPQHCWQPANQDQWQGKYEKFLQICDKRTLF